MSANLKWTTHFAKLLFGKLSRRMTLAAHTIDFHYVSLITHTKLNLKIPCLIVPRFCCTGLFTPSDGDAVVPFLRFCSIFFCFRFISMWCVFVCIFSLNSFNGFSVCNTHLRIRRRMSDGNAYTPAFHLALQRLKMKIDKKAHDDRMHWTSAYYSSSAAFVYDFMCVAIENLTTKRYKLHVHCTCSPCATIHGYVLAPMPNRKRRDSANKKKQKQKRNDLHVGYTVDNLLLATRQTSYASEKSQQQQRQRQQISCMESNKWSRKGRKLSDCRVYVSA